MDWNLIITKIFEVMKRIFGYMNSLSENNFMLVNYGALSGENVPQGVKTWFFMSFVILIFLAILASDSFRWKEPIEEIKEWPYKISIIKVLIFSATIFSIHTFYKMLIIALGVAFSADMSISATACLGAYINPISIMIYAYTISTMEMERSNGQAMILGWAIFLSPAVMTYYNLTLETCTICLMAVAIGIAGAVLYKRCSPYISCAILYIIYFVLKFFMIFCSEKVQLLNMVTVWGNIKKYLSCIQVELYLALILLFVLGIYNITTVEKSKPVKEAVYTGIFVVFAVIATIFGNPKMLYQSEYENAIKLMENSQYEDAKAIFSSLDGYEESSKYILECKQKIIEQTYEVAIDLMEQGQYENAIAEFDKIMDYKDADEKYWICQTSLNAKLAGVWHGEGESILKLIEDGECYYVYGSSQEKGTWYLDRDNTIHIKVPSFQFELYAYCEVGYDSRFMNIKADSSSWNNEYFYKVSNFNENPESVIKLQGIWKSDLENTITLNADGSCHYVDVSSGEGLGTWYVDEYAVIHINTSLLPYELYAFLDLGYDTNAMTVKGVSNSWNDEIFAK